MTIRSFFEENISRNPDRAMFLSRQSGVAVRKTYREAMRRVRSVSELAVSWLGLEPRSNPAAIILDNSPIWIEIYLGCNAIATPVVPIDPKLKAEETKYIIGDSSASAIFTDCAHIGLLEEILPSLECVRSVVFVDSPAKPFPERISGARCFGLEEALSELEAKSSMPGSAYDRYSPAADDIASIIYTSGTTGKPKGALVTNGNFCSDADGALAMFRDIDVSEKDDFFVVLPLFHSFSFNTNFVVPMRVGAGIQFASSLRTIGEDMAHFRPSIVMAVPLLVEKMHAKIEDGIRKNKIAKLLLRLKLDFIVTRRIRNNLGGRIRLFIVGGAPCSPLLLKRMRRLGMPIVEGYGLTEASPIVSIRPYCDNHIGTIGIPLPNIEVKLEDENENGVGELLVRGPIVCKGYLNRPDATKETFDDDGWLHTGDLASRDKDGFLTIRGRKKALIVNREGKNIYPEEVELCLSKDKRIAEAVVVGYREGDDVGEKVGAIIHPDLEYYKAKFKTADLPWDKIEKDVRDAASKQCESLAEYKRPRKTAVFREPLERTSAGKIRRFTYKNALDRP